MCRAGGGGFTHIGVPIIHEYDTDLIEKYDLELPKKTAFSNPSKWLSETVDTELEELYDKFGIKPTALIFVDNFYISEGGKVKAIAAVDRKTNIMAINTYYKDEFSNNELRLKADRFLKEHNGLAFNCVGIVKEKPGLLTCIDHEYGHMFFNTLSSRDQRRWAKVTNYALKNGYSGPTYYSHDSYHEMFAECFACKHNGYGENYVPPVLNKFLDQVMKKQ